MNQRPCDDCVPDSDMGLAGEKHLGKSERKMAYLALEYMKAADGWLLESEFNMHSINCQSPMAISGLSPGSVACCALLVKTPDLAARTHCARLQPRTRHVIFLPCLGHSF